MDELRFWKYHGTGNDFVLLEDVEGRFELGEELARRLCDRRFGIGADGVIRVAPSDNADFFMDHRNSDGSQAQMCGNGIRCLGKLVFDRGLVDRTEIRVGTRSGVKTLALHVEDGSVDSVTVGMGPARFARGTLPMAGDPAEPFVGEPFGVDGRSYKATALSMGNPHLVLFVEEDPDDVDVHRIGPMVERDERFPERTNVEFGPGISAVVGPNGSGKSNLADALRWALGEQGVFLNSVGDLELLPRVLEAAERFDRRPDDTELTTLQTDLRLSTLFV